MMYSIFKIGRSVLCIGFVLFFNFSYAQKKVVVTDSEKQHIFKAQEIALFKENGHTLSISAIAAPVFNKNFVLSHSATPVITDPAATYWYRIDLSNLSNTRNNWILEFFDQTIDSLSVYAPSPNGGYTSILLGSNRPFYKRIYEHKNLSLNISNKLPGTNTYYFRIRSRQSANVIIVLKSVNWFVSYAINEYFFFGIFYGMILVFGLYNLMMFIAMRQRQYLYYIIYNLSIGLYEMCTDGIAYQYLWSANPEWNHYAYGLALYTASVFAMLFAQSLLNLKTYAPGFNNIVNKVILLRSLIFVLCLFNKSWFSYKIIEFVPLSIAFFAGCYTLYRGYRPARFFVVGYSFLFIGFIIKTLIALEVWWFPVTAVMYYSLSFCFIMEMLFITFAIGDRVRLLKQEKDEAQSLIIQQLRQNEELKDTLNKKLEAQVSERTKELQEKSELLDVQNLKLLSTNQLLQHQSEEIARMNVLLEEDNMHLHENIEKVTHDRVMLADMDFEEFSKIYPDRETCFKFLAGLKWGQGYACKKCGSDHYSGGHLPYSRRCCKCGYEESVIAYTILHGTRIPLNKAFYMIFLMYATKGKISSHKLSEILSLRQGTCWTYSTRIKKAMLAKRKDLVDAGSKGWSKLVID